MTSVLNQFVDKILSWEGFVTCLVIGLIGLWWRPGSRVARAWLTAVVAGFGLLSVEIVPYATTKALWRQYRPFVPPPGEDLSVVVLLAAGSETVVGSDQRLGILTQVGAGRVLEAARVYRSLNAPWVISSGGRGAGGRETGAATMKTALVHLGVDPARIRLESSSRSTYEQGVLIAPMLRELRAERFVLVTTRSHMQRSLGVFRAQGLTPMPAVAPDEFSGIQWPESFRFTIYGLQRSDALFHELVGLAYYWWRGWI